MIYAQGICHNNRYYSSFSSVLQYKERSVYCMSVQSTNLIYALRDGDIVSINDVESGLDCRCICPACGNKLVAKKGMKVAYHFSHHHETNCEYGYESSLHLAAKDILSRAKIIVLPTVTLHFPESDKEDIVIRKAQSITIDRVELEQRNDNIVPDVVIYSGGKRLFIEVFVTHRIDDEKLAKLKKNDISTIEIDLSKRRNTISAEELSDILLTDTPEKKWVYNALANKYYEQFLLVSDRRQAVHRHEAAHVPDCPIRKRVWHRQPYANLIDDCWECEYCISVSSTGEILCSGRQRISTLEDFQLSPAERIKNSDERMLQEQQDSILNDICPRCGGKIIARDSAFGVFWSCSHFPHCRFKLIVDRETGELRPK